MLCQHCGQRTANVRVMVNVEGQRAVMGLCSDCLQRVHAELSRGASGFQGHSGVGGAAPREAEAAPAPNLARYSRNLSALAAEGKLDPVIGRDEEIRRAMLLMMEATHNLVEAAGAAPLAAALRLKERLRGRRVVLELSGGNITLHALREVLATS